MDLLLVLKRWGAPGDEALIQGMGQLMVLWLAAVPYQSIEILEILETIETMKIITTIIIIVLIIKVKIIII